MFSPFEWHQHGATINSRSKVKFKRFFQRHADIDLWTCLNQKSVCMHWPSVDQSLKRAHSDGILRFRIRLYSKTIEMKFSVKLKHFRNWVVSNWIPRSRNILSGTFKIVQISQWIILHYSEPSRWLIFFTYVSHFVPSAFIFAMK